MTPDQTKKVELRVSGMTCASCATTIEKSLLNLDDVSTASVNLGKETASVEYDPNKLKLQDLETAVKDAGYDVINERTAIKIGGNASRVKFELLNADGSVILTKEKVFEETPDPRVIDFNFENLIIFRAYKLEVESIDSGEPAHVHLWEVMVNDDQEE